MLLKTCLWTLVGYLAGSLLFSAWLVRIFLGKDIRQTGDGNPGASNAWLAGGPALGIPAIMLDFLKGAVPVGLARFAAGVDGWWLVPAALAPCLGHAFSIFNRFRGGKAAAVTFGIWTALTLWQGPTTLGLLTGLSLVFIDLTPWTVILPAVAFAGYVIPKAILSGAYPLVGVWLGNLALYLVTYRAELREPIRLRRWLRRPARSAP